MKINIFNPNLFFLSKLITNKYDIIISKQPSFTMSSTEYNEITFNEFHIKWFKYLSLYLIYSNNIEYIIDNELK